MRHTSCASSLLATSRSQHRSIRSQLFGRGSCPPSVKCNSPRAAASSDSLPAAKGTTEGRDNAPKTPILKGRRRRCSRMCKSPHWQTLRRPAILSGSSSTGRSRLSPTRDAPTFHDLERELAAFPGDYAPPKGCFLLARKGGHPVGCVAFRAYSDSTVELKRMYVRPDQRRKRIGQELVSPRGSGDLAYECRRFP